MQAETAACFAKDAASQAHGPRPRPTAHQAMARIYARQCAARIAHEGLRLLRGCDLKENLTTLEKALLTSEIHESFTGDMADHDLVAHSLCAAQS
jgi:hypothetical protein